MNKLKNKQWWLHSWVIECLPSMHKALGSIPYQTTKREVSQDRLKYM